MPSAPPTPAAPRITAADASDLDTMMAIMTGGFDPAFGEAWSTAQLAGTLALTGSFAHQAIGVSGDVIGFTLARAAGDEVELLLIAVDREARRQRIGRLLIDEVVKTARARGASEIYLEVRENNVAARRLYHSTGFVDVGRRANYYTGSNGERFAAITMRQKHQH